MTRDCITQARDLAIWVYENANIINADAIREGLKPLLDATDMAIAALREQPRWISVEERLPGNKDHDWVLAQVVEDSGYTHIPKVMEYRQNRNDWFEETYGWISGHNGAFTVTHWMPLPEPPEVEV